MKITRIATSISVVLVVAMLTGCALVGDLKSGQVSEEEETHEQEEVWGSFVEAMLESHLDDVVLYIDFEYMTKKLLGEDDSAEMRELAAAPGGSEVIAKFIESALRTAFSKEKDVAEFGTKLRKIGQPTRIDTKGDFSTLVFDKGGGEEFTAEMQRANGKWKIIYLGEVPGDDQKVGKSWPGGPGSYSTAGYGTTITAEVPADNNNGLVSELEAFRKKAKASEVLYLVISVDNTDGEEEVFVDRIDVVTEDGTRIQFNAAWSSIEQWFAHQSSTTVYNAGVNLHNKHANRGVVRPGAKSEVVLVAKEKLPSVKSVWLDGDFLMEKIE